MRWEQEFLAWSDELDLWFSQYCVLADSVEAFLLGRLAANPTLASQVAGRMWDVLHHCDEITYDETGVAEAYAALHFLDRYHRFQIVSRALVESNLLPIRRQDIDIVDIGTGPGPALFALSDTYAMISRFGSERGLPVLGGLRWSLDYAEKSDSFRQWLHHFTEFLLSEHRDWPWKVPFHHGTFWDFEEIEFDSVQHIVEYDDDGLDYTEQYIEKRRYDVVVLSNFLTTADQVVSFAEQLRKCARYLRNRGLLLVVGARAESPKYADVYGKLSEVVETGRYGNWKLIASCRRVGESSKTLCYSYADRYGGRLKRLYATILEGFSEMGAVRQIPQAALKAIEAAIEPTNNRDVVWRLELFRKHSRVRSRRERA